MATSDLAKATNTAFLASRATSNSSLAEEVAYRSNDTQHMKVESQKYLVCALWQNPIRSWMFRQFSRAVEPKLVQKVDGIPATVDFRN